MNAPAREYRWMMPSSPSGMCKLFAAPIAGEKLEIKPGSGRVLYATVYPYGDGRWRADYWKLEPPPADFGVDPLMYGGWEEFPVTCRSREEAIALAEAAMLLNMGGWP